MSSPPSACGILPCCPVAPADASLPRLSRPGAAPRRLAFPSRQQPIRPPPGKSSPVQAFFAIVPADLAAAAIGQRTGRPGPSVADRACVVVSRAAAAAAAAFPRPPYCLARPKCLLNVAPEEGRVSAVGSPINWEVLLVVVELRPGSVWLWIAVEGLLYVLCNLCSSSVYLAYTAYLARQTARQTAG